MKDYKITIIKQKIIKEMNILRWLLAIKVERESVRGDITWNYSLAAAAAAGWDMSVIIVKEKAYGWGNRWEGDWVGLMVKIYKR